MPLRLSPDTEAVVNALFVPQDRDEAVRLLINECGNNIPNSKDQDEFQLEDLRLQVLCRSKGDLKQLSDAIDIAKHDFRELFGTGNIKAFKREVLGNPQAAQLIRFFDHFFKALLVVSGVVAFGIGATAISFYWLTLPILLVAIATEAIYRNSTDKPVLQVRGFGDGLLLLTSRLWPGIAISGVGYLIGLIGHFVAKMFIR